MLELILLKKKSCLLPKKLFLMVEGSQKKQKQKQRPCSGELLETEVQLLPGWSTGATGLLSSTVTVKLKLLTKRQQIQEGYLQSPSNSVALPFV